MQLSSLLNLKPLTFPSRYQLILQAHSILRLGTGHLIKLPHQNGVPLMDLVGKCRTLAAQIFLDHLRRQRDQLTATFKEAGVNLL